MKKTLAPDYIQDNEYKVQSKRVIVNRVNLDVLKKKLKETQKAEKKNNIIFVGAAITTLVVSGIIISL